jgi:hypothetical protein
MAAYLDHLYCLHQRWSLGGGAASGADFGQAQGCHRGNSKSSNQSMMAFVLNFLREGIGQEPPCCDRFLIPSLGNSGGNPRSGSLGSDDGGARHRSTTCGRRL